MNSQSQSKTRPKIFRALGDQQPPAEIQINDIILVHVKTIKHDSWAATALYENSERGRKVVCKFNRTQPIGFFPMRWLGWMLARREIKMYQRLADLPNVAEGFATVHVDGKLVSHAAAHEFIEGHPLRWFDNVNDSFFDKLESTLCELHRRSIAYVDMNKSENVIIDRNGDPCLIDFQISVRLPRLWPISWVLRLLQRSDLYHCEKLKRRYRPDLVSVHSTGKPWWIRLHRKIADPFRAVRRGLLVRLGIRKGIGKPQTEAFIEEGLREGGDVTETNVPILQLHALLVGADYYRACGGSNERYSEQLFQDVVGAPQDSEDQALIAHMKRVPAFCKVVDLLRYRRTFVESQRWAPDWIDAKLKQLRNKIAARRSNNAAA